MSPSEQARADALADAATLRLNVTPWAMAEEAYRLGGWVIVELRTWPDQAAGMAVAAAKAAFAAVPGLRG